MLSGERREEEELDNYFITHKISNFSHNSWRVQTKTLATFDIFLLPNFYNLCPRMFSISSVQTSYYEEITFFQSRKYFTEFQFRCSPTAKINNSASSALLAITQFQTFGFVLKNYLFQLSNIGWRA